MHAGVLVALDALFAQPPQLREMQRRRQQPGQRRLLQLQQQLWSRLRSLPKRWSAWLGSHLQKYAHFLLARWMSQVGRCLDDQ